MTKNLTAYYGLLTLAVLAQTIMTVFSLSQNIGYGQKISFLEDKKTALQAEQNLLRTQLAEKTAINKLEEADSNFIAITQVVTIGRDSASLALK